MWKSNSANGLGVLYTSPSQWVHGKALVETQRVKPLEAQTILFLKQPTLTQIVFFKAKFYSSESNKATKATFFKFKTVEHD